LHNVVGCSTTYPGIGEIPRMPLHDTAPSSFWV
jgi:hypothetical protein